MGWLVGRLGGTFKLAFFLTDRRNLGKELKVRSRIGMLS
jgi:hypothetical protein